MKYAVFILMVFTVWEGFSQETSHEDIKVGLVLSGGGAKGLAHIGVLEVIDSLGVNIDYIAGTSMGAIVGGLYASGYSGKQLDSIFRSIDFETLISDDLPRSSKAFFERNNSEKYAVSLPFENFKIKLPSAISRGQNMYDLFSELTLHTSGIRDFSQLSIPFFCVATNVETGEPVFLKEGSLARSILASGSFPSLFQPVNINDQVLIDGGVVNNYPIDELRAKGMDIIIGVDVQDGLASREELSSAIDVLVQINNYRTINDMKLKADKTDIYLKPDIKEYGVISFDAGAQIIENGKQSAINKIQDLKHLLVVDGVHFREKLKIEKQDSITINEIQVKGLKNYTRAYVLGKLKLKTNERISYKSFVDGINNLIATNNFDAFQYELHESEDQKGYNLLSKVEETKANTFLKLGVHYDKLYKSAVLLNLTKKRLLFNNDVASLDLILGDNVRYNFEYFIDKGFYWSIGVKSRYQQFDKNINASMLLSEDELNTRGINKLDVELGDLTNQFYLQTLFRKDVAISAGIEHKRLKVTSETFVDTSEDFETVFDNTNYLSLFGQLKIDTYDNKYFPTKGGFFKGDLHNYFYASHFNAGFNNFTLAKANMGYAFTPFRNMSFIIQSSGGFKVGDKSTKTLDFALGGYGNNLINNFVPFLGYDFISLTGNSYVQGSLTVNYEFLKKHYISLIGNWSNIEDDIFDSGEWFTAPDYSGYSLGYGFDTFLGPIEIKYTYSPELHDSIWFFNVGYWF
ncbi:patatin-like phospholipase family protein [Gaetbulibacter saemankumensis]|uniref:patatin-like phospholipase family protein n=1 Tax=Gaetbulibacter saemankumensis TaxID=311208 RepID=UPI00040F59F0|nr:patatin-like phospholipase family protein [Gaetbulibacter saemankumensis]